MLVCGMAVSQEGISRMQRTRMKDFRERSVAQEASTTTGCQLLPTVCIITTEVAVVVVVLGRGYIRTPA